MEKIKCPKCGYEWEPRVKNPKECPECKKRLRREVKP
ncbi:MAG TPA: RCKP-type rubredoxin-like domain-containing protein [Candidatus Wunengus sp. YC61]